MSTTPCRCTYLQSSFQAYYSAFFVETFSFGRWMGATQPWQSRLLSSLLPLDTHHSFRTRTRHTVAARTLHLRRWAFPRLVITATARLRARKLPRRVPQPGRQGGAAHLRRSRHGRRGYCLNKMTNLATSIPPGDPIADNNNAEGQAPTKPGPPTSGALTPTDITCTR